MLIFYYSDKQSKKKNFQGEEKGEVVVDIEEEWIKDLIKTLGVNLVADIKEKILQWIVFYFKILL